MPWSFYAHTPHRRRGDLDGAGDVAWPPPPMPAIAADAALVADRL